ncbi:hypothetical protein CAPTEDRAFT_214334, partial [Capitella teleta]
GYYLQSLKGVNLQPPCSYEDVDPSPINTQPEHIIQGGASIRQYNVLNDKRHIITKDTDNNVAVYDALTASKVEDLGQISLEEELKRRFKMVYIPNWFTVDLKTGLLTIHLEEADCFAAWVSAKEVGMGQSNDGSDPKLNFGGLILQALLEYWPKTHTAEVMETDHFNSESQPSDNRKGGNPYFSVPGHTPVIFSEVGGRTMFRLLCRDAAGETEQMMLNEVVPPWVMDITVDMNMPKFNKIPFFLQPHSSSGIKCLKKDRLSASDMLQVRKVIEHVYEKVINQGSETGSASAGTAGAGGTNSTTGSQAEKSEGTEKEEDLASIAEEKVELLCNDQVLDANLDLRTVRHFIWKSGGELTLHYRPINTK